MDPYPKTITADEVVKVLLDQPGNKGQDAATLRSKWIPSEKFYLIGVHVGLPDLGVTPDKPGKFVTEAPIIVDQNIQEIARGAGGVGKKAPAFMVLDGQNRTTAARKLHGPMCRLQAYVGEKILRDLQAADIAYGQLGKGLEETKERFLASAEIPGESPGERWSQVEEYAGKGVLTPEDLGNIRDEWQRRKSGRIVGSLIEAGKHRIGASLVEVIGGVVDHPGSHVGVFLRLPDEIGSQFPPRGGDDSSRPHVTALYIGDVDPGRKDELARVIRESLKDQAPFEAALAKEADYFPPSEHSDNKKVAIMPLESQVLHDINAKLLKDVEAAGFETPHSYPRYEPHATLEYLAPSKETFDGKVPAGHWTVDCLELWGFDEPVRFRLRS